MIELGGVLTQAKAQLYQFPDNGIKAPITNKSYWEGRYVYCELTLETEEGKKLVCPIAVVNLQRSKQIISTQLVGGEGAIHEYVSNGDYEVGIYIDLQSRERDDYPEDLLRSLKTITESNKPLTVYSKFFELFDIDRLIIRSYQLEQETHSNSQAVSLTAVSDNEYNVYSTDY